MLFRPVDHLVRQLDGAVLCNCRDSGQGGPPGMHELLLRQGWDGGQRIGLGDAAAGVVGLRLSGGGSLSESLGDRVLLAAGSPSCCQ